MTRSPVTFADILRDRAINAPGAVAFVFIDGEGDETERLTYGELYARSQLLAQELLRQELSGRRVLLAFPSGPEFIIALFACFDARAIAVPTPYLAGRRSTDRLLAICRDAEPAAALTSRRLSHDADLRSLAVGHSDLAWIYIDEVEPGSVPPPANDGASSRIALLQYTSGSTGSPKGVILTHDNIMANNAMIAQAFNHDNSLRGVGWLPLFHDMGLIGHVLQPVYVGGLSVLMSPLTFLQRPARWLKAISKWKATTSGGPSYAYDLCLRAPSPTDRAELDLSAWRVAYCGAEPVRAGVLQRFATRFEPCGFSRSSLHPCYGLAEATLLVTSVGAGAGLNVLDAVGEAPSGRREAVSCGRPWAGGTLTIADPQTRRALRDGEVGEICVSGPHVSPGYWADAEIEPEIPQPGRGEDSGRVLATGDLGFVHNGDLFIVGRLKDVIVVLGQNHAAEDLEATIADSHPSFQGRLSAAFAVDHQEREHAVVVQEVSRRADSNEDLDAARTSAVAAVARVHGLRLLDFVLVRNGALPRTSSGKVQRNQAKSLYIGGDLHRLGLDDVGACLDVGGAPQKGSAEDVLSAKPAEAVRSSDLQPRGDPGV